MSDFNDLLSTPLYRAMNRHSLFMGADRELMLFTILIAFAFIFTSLKPWVIVASLLMTISLTSVLRLMAKADPQMRMVYMRHRKYKAYYKANSTPFAKFNEIR